MSEQPLNQKLIEAYNRMLERTRAGMGEAGKGMQHALDAAMEKASELGELSREEAEKVSEYVKRDLQDAAEFISESGDELRDWLRFDMAVVENSLLDLFSDMVDHTRDALTRLELRANALGEWHTGEITSIGTLQCKGCGEKLHFHHTGHIPPCPKCHGTAFRRISTRDE
jgi:predicted RNA-binding Zn-ribbon protein involved in translation (DUF1610 family)